MSATCVGYLRKKLNTATGQPLIHAVPGVDCAVRSQGTR